MEREQILERLRRVMQEASTEIVDWDQLDEKATIESLGFDSLSILDVLYGVEQEFEIEVDAEEIVDLETVAELVSALEERL